MARKLKAYETSIGFYDLAVAAPSMKAALDAWGAGSNLFHQGVAKESQDAAVVAATMAKPGLVLRRPVGSDGRFGEHVDLPDHLADVPHEPRKRSSEAKKQAPLINPSPGKAARLFEKQQQRREDQRRREAVAEQKRRQHRNQAIANAQSALEKSRKKHGQAMATIEGQRKALEQRSEAEISRWERERRKLEDALRKAGSL